MILSDFFVYFQQELGDQLFEIVGERAFERWVDAGQRKLGLYRQRTATLTWAVGDASVALPSDWHHTEEFVASNGSCALPAGHAWGGVYSFSRPATSAGTGTLRYHGVRPRITDTVASTLDDEGNEALISYALYRFFKRLASSRTDYRMYATITQANGVDIGELDAMSERHLQDFKDAVESMTVLSSTTFYED